jgi:hypothetical protein
MNYNCITYVFTNIALFNIVIYSTVQIWLVPPYPISAHYYKECLEIPVMQREKSAFPRLTPKKCARLMGFDRAGMEPMKILVLDIQAYEQFGNSIVVHIVESNS